MAKLREFNLTEGLEREQQDQLRDISRKTMQLDEGIKEGRSGFEKFVYDMEHPVENIEKETGKQLSKVDTAITIGERMRDDIASLTSGLKAKYTTLGEIFEDAQEYKGFWEQFCVKVGWTDRADAMQYRRVANQNVKENLEQILSYGALATGKIGEIAVVLAANEKLLLTDIDNTQKIIADNEPQYTGWRDKREAMEDEVRLLDEKVAAGETSPQILQELEAVRREYQKAKSNEDKFFTVYEKAKHAYPIQRRQLESIQSIKSDLENYRIAIQEDIKHVTNIYKTVDDNLKAALAAKGAEEFSKAKNVATEIALKASAHAQRGVADVVAREAESHLIPPDKLAYITQFMIDTVTDFNDRMEATKVETADYRQT